MLLFAINNRINEANKFLLQLDKQDSIYNLKGTKYILI